MEGLTASSETVKLRTLLEDEPESKTDHRPDQFLSTLLTTVKDDTDHKPDQFFSIQSTHSGKPISGIIGQNAEQSSVDHMTVGPAETLDSPEIEGINPTIVQEKGCHQQEQR